LAETIDATAIDDSKTVLEISTPHPLGQPKGVHNRIRPDHRSARRLRATRMVDPTGSFTTPLNPRRRTLGRCARSNVQHSRWQTAIPGQTIRPDSGPRSVVRSRSPVVR